VLVLTHLPATLIDAKTIGELYRVRWQVELYIMRLKCLLELDRLRARQGSDLAGKRIGRQWTYLAQRRQGSWWRVWQLHKPR